MNPASAITPSIYASENAAIAAGGYHALPIGGGTLFPALKRWQEKCHIAPTKEERDRWSRTPGVGIGLAMGSPIGDDHHVIAVDIDVDGEDFDLLAAAVPQSPMEKFGSKGITRLFRAPKAFKTMRFNRADDDSRLVDLLSVGAQTVWAPTISPRTLRPYVMTGHFVPADELPTFEEDDLNRLKDALGAVGWDGNVVRSKVASKDQAPLTSETLSVEDEFFRDLNDRALANLDLWVGSLGLWGTRRLRNGAWEAVNTMRGSSTGRALEKRKANLKFHWSGIRDMGSGVGYRPTWLVSELFGLDSYAAANWLRDLIGDTQQDIENDAFFALKDAPRRFIEHDDGSLVDESTGEIVGGANDNVAPRTEDAFPDELTRPAGVLGEMVDHIVATARKPSRALALGAAIVALGSLCGRRDATPTLSETALYVIGLAETGAGKQQPQDAGEAMVRAATEDRGDDIMGPSDLMSESAIVNELIYRPHSCSYVDEFGDLVAKINSPSAKSFETGIKKVLLQIWGKPYTTWKTPSYAKQRAITLHSVSFSMFGASTPNKFYDALSGDDRENGFLNRFLIIPETGKPKSVEPAYDWRQVPQDLKEKLRRIYEIDREPLEAYTDEGKASNDPWHAREEPHRRNVGWASDEAKAIYDKFSAECDGLGHYYARSAEMAGRIATIVAVGREWEAPAVAVDDIRYGVQVARWSAGHMAKQAGNHIGGGGAAGAERSRIFRKVQQSGGRIAQSEVMRHLGISAKALNEHVRDMGPDGTGQLAIQSIAPAGGGRPKTYLSLASG